MGDFQMGGTEKFFYSGHTVEHFVAPEFKEIIANWNWYLDDDNLDIQRTRCGECHIGLYQDSYLAKLGHLYNYHKYNRDGTQREL